MNIAIIILVADLLLVTHTVWGVENSAIRPPQNTETVNGRNARTTCPASGSPTPNIISFKSEEEKFKVHGELHISYIHPNDAGNYTCEAMSKNSRRSASANLTVKHMACAKSTPSCSCLRKILNCTGLELKSMPIDVREGITKFYLDNNLLGESFSNVSFSAYGCIELLSLSNNNITKFYQHAIQGLQNLAALNISYNRLINIDKNTFNGSDELIIVDSSHNKLSHVSTDMFKNLRKLKYLNISNNQIDTIAKDAFAALENLIELNLEHNWIHTLTSSVFESLKSLNHLYLQHNNISDVQTSALEGLQSIIVANMSYNLIKTLPPCLFHTKKEHCHSDSKCTDPVHYWKSLQILDLRHNKIAKMPSCIFKGLKNLSRLFLQSNSIDDVKNFAFDGLHELYELDLSNNSIKTLPTCLFRNSTELCAANANHIHNYTYDGPQHLKILRLDSNKMTDLSSQSFDGLKGLDELYLQNNRIKTIQKNSFANLESLTILNISCNFLTELFIEMFQGLNEIKKLNMKGNDIGYVEKGAFQNLTVEALEVSDHRFCCILGSSTTCEAPQFLYSSCSDLTANSIIRIFVWILGIIAVVSNTGVFLIQTFSRSDKSQVTSFQIKNLALSDLFMGVYLLIIACTELWYAKDYGKHDYEWRNSSLCYFAGFLSIFSSELTVFILTAYTLDRLHAVTSFQPCQRRGLRKVAYRMGVCWILALVIAAIPLPIFQLTYFDKFYSQSAVCLPFHLTPDVNVGWQYSSIVFIGLNAISFSIIAISYIKMICHLHKSTKTTNGMNVTNRPSNRSTAIRMTAIVLADAACWIPIIVLGTRSLVGYSMTRDVYAWIAQFVLPLNAALNPILYSLSTKQMIDLCCMPFGALYKEKNHSNPLQTGFAYPRVKQEDIIRTVQNLKKRSNDDGTISNTNKLELNEMKIVHEEDIVRTSKNLKKRSRDYGKITISNRNKPELNRKKIVHVEDINIALQNLKKRSSDNGTISNRNKPELHEEDIVPVSCENKACSCELLLKERT